MLREGEGSGTASLFRRTLIGDRDPSPETSGGTMDTVIAGLLGLMVGGVAGFVVRNTIGASNARSAEAQAKKLLLDAEEEAAKTRALGLQESKDEAARMRRETEEDLKHRREEVARLERRITETESDLRERGQRMDARDLRAQGTGGQAHVRPRAAREGRGPAQGAARADRRHDVGGGEGPARVPGDRRSEARRDGPGARDRAARAGGGRGAGSEDRHDRDPAGRLGADGGVDASASSRSRART